MNTITDLFGINVFNEAVMRQRLPDDIFDQLCSAKNEGKRLSREAADIIAAAMKDWAVEKGATHFSHWFQPLTGITAEKHDSFISPTGEDRVILEFSGKELIQGEPDASSFPSGGLRATFEARGYTAWDPTSYAFLKDNVLCVPTAFCSYGGEALDMKTPLLRSMEAINRQGLRIMKLFGNSSVRSIRTTVGAEQEYFLIDRSVYDRRKDLIYTGRTLFGALPPKGQELSDHYFGTLKPRVASFMKELDEELWKLGIMAKTEHNEAAPGQHELACVFTTANIATDNNQLTMEIMQKVARKYDMVCLLHEKPFDGVNGSGKHNNWSISTDEGENLLEPGDTPYDNARFLLFLCAVIQAVDDYQDLLRLSVSSESNDYRTCGADEAPPAIISMFIGSELENILSAIEKDESYGGINHEEFKVGVHVLPKFPKDSTDRNRTSPMAFTGNKFEFRMPGSMQSISAPNVALNTAVAESLRQYADVLENAGDFEQALHDLLRSVIRKHKRIIFNGNNYGPDWEKEAQRRGLLNLPSLPDCASAYISEKNIRLYAAHRVYTETELRSRYEIKLDTYSKLMTVEALTMLNMSRREILPAVSRFSGDLARAANEKKALSPDIDCSYELSLVSEIGSLLALAVQNTDRLGKDIKASKQISGSYETARYFRDVIFRDMAELRRVADKLERMVSRDYWPFPVYGDILFSVK
jgi:glutamine synthetase